MPIQPFIQGRHAAARRVLLAWLLAVCTSSAAAAQGPPGQIRFEHLSVEHGLSHSVVRAVYQGRLGRMWIATQDGLNLYDGYRVTTLRHDPDDDNSLRSNLVTSLAETNGTGGSTMWIGTLRGLTAYDVARHRFVHYTHDPANPDSLGHEQVHSLAVGAEGAVWVGTGAGLNRLDPATGVVTRYPGDPGTPRANQNLSIGRAFIGVIVPDPDGSIWVGTPVGLHRLDPSTHAITRYRHDPANPTSLNHDHVRSLLVDRGGTLWVGTDAGGLDRLDRATGTFAHHVAGPGPGRISGNSINALIEDANGTIWVGVWGGGINRLQPGTRHFTSYRHVATDAHSLAIDDVNVLARDRSGVVWVGTYGGGVSRFKPSLSSVFTHWRHVVSDPGSLSDDRVYAVLVDRGGTLWVGTWGGINKLAPGAAAFERIVHRPGDPSSLADNRVMSLAEAPDGTIWIATLDGGLNRLDPRTGRVKRYPYGRPGTVGSDDLTTVYVDRAGTLWAGTLVHGIHRHDAATDTFTAWTTSSTNAASLSNNRISSILDDSRGTLWIGTASGLDILDRATGQVTRAHAMPGAGPALRSFIASIDEGPDGTLWIGTADAGVVRLTRQADGTLAMRTYRERDGLPNDRVYQALAATDGRIWISTNNGVARLDPRDHAIRTFGARDGLQGDEFKNGGFADDRTGRVYLGGANGLSAFLPADVTDSEPPPVVLTGFSIFNRPVPIGGNSPLQVRIGDTQAVTLPYQDNVFTIEFAALDFWSQARIQYAYRMEGIDDDWNITDSSRRSATYTTLAPDTYVFKVRASHGGAWSEPRELRVVILPPFWLTWWFRTAAVLVALGTVVGLHQWRLRKVEAQRERLEAIVETRTSELRHEKENVTAALRVAEQASAAKTTFLTNISHEIRTPLNAIVGMADMLKETPLDDQQQEYAGALRVAGVALSELVDDTLDLSKIEVGRFELQPDTFDIRQLVEETAGILRVRARQKGLTVACTIAPEVPSRVAGDPKALRRVLINLLGNAVKFTESGRVTVRVEPTTSADVSRLRFQVADTGMGIPADKHEMIFETFTQADSSISREYGGTGLGLAISRQLVELMGGRIHVDSEIGRGSTFTFTAALPAAGSPLPDADADPAAAARVPLRILLVEDAPQNRLLIAAYLKDQPDAIDVAVNGREALDRFTQERYDVVLMDVHMPLMDGYAATREIRAMEAAQGLVRTPVVALTAHGYDEDVANSRAAGCDDHLTKPISKGVLLRTLDRYRSLAAGSMGDGRG